MTTALVLKESAHDLLAEILALDIQPLDNDMAAVDGLVQEHGPLVRAMMRAEAELLVADALAMQVGTYETRTPDQRRADALVLVMNRTADVTMAA